MKRYSDATLMGMSKKELIDELRVAERNCEAMEETLNQQAENMKSWEPVRHGRWVLKHRNSRCDYVGDFKCSLCGNLETLLDDDMYLYCPHCGAKMDLEVKND